MTEGSATNFARCSDCETDLGPDDPEQREPCPNCGSTKRTVSIQAHVRIGLSMRAALSGFIDHSSAETEVATTTAIKEITAWVGDADRLTIKHIIDGNLTASNVGVPIGPFDDDEGQQIVKTVFNDAEGLRTEQRDWTKSVITWLLSLASLILLAFGVWLAYLKYFSDN